MEWVILILLIIIGLAVESGFKDLKERMAELQADVDSLKSEPLEDDPEFSWAEDEL